MTTSHGTVVVGAGPAGLTAAYELTRSGHRALVLEADEVVGGISRTAQYKGYRFDVGGHRFFTKVAYVQELWEEILDEEFLIRPRLSRIHYKGKLFDYPLKPLNALIGLGPLEALRVALSYARVAVRPKGDERTFEEWVVNRFGRRLYEVFFKTYTEKVWGMPCSEISAEWAAQRIKNLDLVAAVRNALFGGARAGDAVITTLIDEFRYPRFGPGQMWERCAALIAQAGGQVRLRAPVARIRHRDGRVEGLVVRTATGEEFVAADQVLSSMPVRTLVRSLDPAPPPEVLAAADALRYRDFLTVALIIDAEELFPDNWIYVHSPDVRVGRIQNYKNWSPDMVPDPSRTALGLEYFVQQGDDLWSAPDHELVELARTEIDRLGLAPAAAVLDGTVLRMPKAYPVYDERYKEALDVIRGWLGGLSNLQLIGRNGQHRYNNQDHSMMTGVYAARNTLGAALDVWGVNVEQEYHEENRGGGDRMVPSRVPADDFGELVRRTFGRYDPRALAIAVGTVLGAFVFLITAIPLLTGAEEELAPMLSLLGHYLGGYSVGWAGALLATGEAGLLGAAVGWLLGHGLNLLVEHERRRVLRAITSRAWLEGEVS